MLKNNAADFLIFAGDLMTDGDDVSEIQDFLRWFGSLDQFTHKVLVAGNHDCYFESS